MKPKKRQESRWRRYRAGKLSLGSAYFSHLYSRNASCINVANRRSFHTSQRTAGSLYRTPKVIKGLASPMIAGGNGTLNRSVNSWTILGYPILPGQPADRRATLAATTWQRSSKGKRENKIVSSGILEKYVLPTIQWGRTTAWSKNDARWSKEPITGKNWRKKESWHYVEIRRSPASQKMRIGSSLSCVPSLREVLPRKSSRRLSSVNFL